jgi:hypothetical protein
LSRHSQTPFEFVYQPGIIDHTEMDAKKSTDPIEDDTDNKTPHQEESQKFSIDTVD